VKNKKLIIIFVLIVLLAFIFIPGYTKLHNLRARNQELELQVIELEEENIKLIKEQERLEKDKVYIEKVAREEMGVAREGEVIYKIEE